VLLYLGTHQPHWLERLHVPLCVSDGTLRERKSLPHALEPWFLDSQGFTMLSLYGTWLTTPKQYARRAQRYQQEIGQLTAASIQDWMVEPCVREMTGLSVAQHQSRTIESYFTLRSLAPEVPWVPVLQGWTLGDYLTHVALYNYAGVDLRTVPLVGVGSICRRQHTQEAATILTTLAGLGLSLHAFGLKQQGLQRVGHLIASADSMAWSFAARRLQHPTCGSTTHKNCANCHHYALAWRTRLLNSLPN
jgi:hypothetical protein